MNTLFMGNKPCDACHRKGLETEVRTLGNERHACLCKECIDKHNDTHFLYDLPMHHRLIALDPPVDDTGSASDQNKDLTSDVSEKMTASETTVPYWAQSVNEDLAHIKKKEELESNTEGQLKKKIDISKLKATKIFEFCVKRSDDRQNVYGMGVLALVDKVVFVDRDNMKLKLFDSGGNFLSSTDLMHRDTYGITLVDKDRFATCGYDRKVFQWTLRGGTILCEDVAYDLDDWAFGIHYNGTYYCVLHQPDRAVTILDKQGRRVRKIVMKEAFGKEIMFGCNIHMDSDIHYIYIICWGDNSGVLCISVLGEALWFSPLSNADLWGIIEIHDILCVADSNNQCLQMISKTGQYLGKLLEKGTLQGFPRYICSDEHNQELYVSFSVYDAGKRDKICVFALQL